MEKTWSIFKRIFKEIVTETIKIQKNKIKPWMTRSAWEKIDGRKEIMLEIIQRKDTERRKIHKDLKKII